ncbi:hypothetical protein F2Q69_00029675 [Brassica cretica]|uniref:Uncharacterized protein n=1 Tax=Brassica cretica TaxID=69181 RepID=A0A8S9S6L5_BRACR|nr:hypothetical protein F2Q69_00029675 [Brassica cretica]
MADNCVKSHKREVRERKKWSRFGTGNGCFPGEFGFGPRCIICLNESQLMCSIEVGY